MDNLKEVAKRYLTGWKTIPNYISFVRIALIPVFGVLFYKGFLGWAVAILILSGITDFIDGKIARKFNQISELGKMLDPLADKLTQITIAILLFMQFNSCGNELMNAYSWIFLIFIAKEAIFVIGGVTMLMCGLKPTAAEIYGKVATFVFYGVMVVMFVFGPEVGVLSAKYALPDVWCIVLVAVSAILALIAFVAYMPDVFRQIKEKRNQSK